MQPYPLAHGCDSALNLWCDHNCPHFATHGRLLARYDTSAQGHSNAWRCYAASTLTADGARYEGGFLANRFHGRGRMRYANGDSYEGEWADDKRHGHGTLRCASGRVDEGEWRGGIFVSA